MLGLRAICTPAVARGALVDVVVGEAGVGAAEAGAERPTEGGTACTVGFVVSVACAGAVSNANAPPYELSITDT